MKLETLNDAMLKRYLLDDISDEERQAVEERFLEDDNIFEELNALEDELHYDYQQNRLGVRERQAFEQKFLASTQDVEKADFARAFLQATEEIRAEQKAPGLWPSIRAFFTFANPAFRFGTAVAAVLILFAFGFMVFNNLNPEPVIVVVPDEINTNTPTPPPNLPDANLIREKQKEQEELQKKLDLEKQKQAQDANKIKELEQQKEKLRREIESNRPPMVAPKTEQKTLVALVLTPLLRGSGTMPRARITPETRTLSLNLAIKKGITAEQVKIIVRDVDTGGQIWSGSSRLGNRKSISLSIPAKNLKRGDYEVVLIDSADNEELDSYYFSIDK